MTSAWRWSNPTATHHTDQFFAPRGRTEGAWDPLSLVEGTVRPHSQERARMNHLLQSDHAFTQETVALVLLKSGQSRSSFHFEMTSASLSFSQNFMVHRLSCCRMGRKAFPLPWRGPAACPELGLKRGARRSLS